jgi:formate hydrogenlyase subunit 6/NADH:ubiquinone oxidoreductase subunit I/flavodoxin
MKIETVKVISFSPTGGSKKVAEAIARGTQAPIEYVDLTPPSARTQQFQEFTDELAIISVPVYAGRVPTEAANRIRRLTSKRDPFKAKRAHKIPAVIVVTYGNRAYEDALYELGDIVSEVGFQPIAAGVFLCEHSFSVPEVPTAHGRPDAKDLATAEAFGKQIRTKYEKADGIEDLSPVTPPGTSPYSLSMRANLTWYDYSAVATPSTNEDQCTKCGTCVDACPTAAIRIQHVSSNPSPMIGYNLRLISTDHNACIWCCACVKHCPTGARVMSKRVLKSQSDLNKGYPDRKEPETYL